MAETLVLDANALSERGFPVFLKGYAGRKVLPAVAAAEVFYHLSVERRWDEERFWARLREMRVEVEPLDGPRAIVAASLADHTWKEHKADWLIGAHAVAPGHVLVTNNAADYPHVLRKMTPTQLMSRRRG